MNKAIFLVVMFLYYLVLATQLARENLVAALAAVVIALALQMTLRHHGVGRFHLSRGQVGALAKACARVPRDSVRVGAVLLRTAIAGGSPGRGIVTPFRFGTHDDDRERNRRAAAITAGSLTPDAIVIDAAPGESVAALHRITRSQATPDSEWLV